MHSQSAHLRAVADFLDEHPDLAAAHVTRDGVDWHLNADKIDDWKTQASIIMADLGGTWTVKHVGSFTTLDGSGTALGDDVTLFVPRHEDVAAAEVDHAALIPAGLA